MNVQWKLSFKAVKIWQNYGHESVTPLFCPPCIHIQQSNISETMLSCAIFTARRDQLPKVVKWIIAGTNVDKQNSQHNIENNI